MSGTKRETGFTFTIDGVEVRDAKTFGRMIGSKIAGDKLRLSVLRKKKTLEFEAVLGSPPIR